MSELIDRQTLDRAFTQLRFDSDGKLAHWGDRKDWCLHGSEVEKLISDAPTIPAPRWHRVEEPPKETAKYLVWVDVNNGVFAAYPELRTAAYNVVYERWYVDGDQRTEWIGTPRYWMPIEPPKEITNE